MAVTLGIINVFLNLPVVDYYLKRANLGIFYDLLHIVGTSSLLANFMLPILIVSLGILLITGYKFIRSSEMQKQIKMRKVSQTLLHLGIVIALIGALISYNSTQINDVLLSPNESGYITTAQDIKLQVLDVNYTPVGSNFQDKLQAHVQLVDNNNHSLGHGVLDYTNYDQFGLIVNVLIIPSLTNDIYITIMTFTGNTITKAVSDIRFEIRIIPMINFLWLGASLVLISMLALVIISLRLFTFSYKKSNKNISTIDKSTIRNNIPINGAV